MNYNTLKIKTNQFKLIEKSAHLFPYILLYVKCIKLHFFYKSI